MGLVAGALGVVALLLAETAAAEVLLAVFMAAIFVMWTVGLLVHAGAGRRTRDLEVSRARGGVSAPRLCLVRDYDANIRARCRRSIRTPESAPELHLALVAGKTH